MTTRMTDEGIAELHRAYASALYKLGYICGVIGVPADEDLSVIEAKLRADRAELVAARRHLSGRSEGETFVSHHQPTKREIP